MSRGDRLKTYHWLAGTAGIALAVAPAYAQSRHQRPVELHPYIEAGQVLSADLGNNDILTYSTVSVGVDATVQTRRVQVQLSYRYEHRFSYDKDIGDDSIHTGLVTAAVEVAPGFSLEAGGIATRTRSDIRGSAAPGAAPNARNVSQVYSAYAGPTYAGRVGPVNVGAGYRFGYTKVDSPGDTGVPAGQTPLDAYDSSTTHFATASAGVRAGDLLPVGVTMSGAWEREDAKQLDQRYDGKYARGEAILPVGRGLAVTAGVGYEKIQASQRDPLTGPGGAPVRDRNGRFVTDPASPRRIAFDIDGLFYDAGVIWHPSPRTTLQARVGKRYDSLSYTGSLSYQLGPHSGFQIGVYDSVDSFGRSLGRGLSSLPTHYQVADDPFGNGLNGCVFSDTSAPQPGAQPGSTPAAGGCLGNVFQSISTANYRARGVDAVFSINSGGTSLGIGAGYANRKFLAPDVGPAAALDGATDESIYAQLFASRMVGPTSTVGANAYATYSKSGLPGADGTFGWGANANYGRSFGKLSATASAGLYGYDVPDGDDILAAQALLAIRYGF